MKERRTRDCEIDDNCCAKNSEIKLARVPCNGNDLLKMSRIIKVIIISYSRKQKFKDFPNRSRRNCSASCNRTLISLISSIYLHFFRVESSISIAMPLYAILMWSSVSFMQIADKFSARESEFHLLKVQWFGKAKKLICKTVKSAIF